MRRRLRSLRAREEGEVEHDRDEEACPHRVEFLPGRPTPYRKAVTTAATPSGRESDDDDPGGQDRTGTKAAP